MGREVGGGYQVHQGSFVLEGGQSGCDYSEVLGRVLRVERDMRLSMIDLTSTTASGVDNLRIPQSPRNRQMHKITVDAYSNWEDFTARRKGTPEGLVLIVPSLNQLPEEQTEAVRAYIGRNLFHGAESFRRKVWVICRNAEAKPQEMRTFAENFGLVEINDGKDDVSHLVWVSGRPRRKGEHAPVDLTHRSYYPRIREDVVAEYVEQGFKVISDEEAREKCGSAKNAKEAYGNLKSGMGVFVEAPCGCILCIGFNHDQKELVHCDGDDCYKNDEEEHGNRIVLNKRVPLPHQDCWDCGSPLEITAVALIGKPDISRGPNSQAVRFEVYCSNNRCQLHEEPMRSGTKFVDPQRIVHPQRRGK